MISNRFARSKIAKETVEICEKGFYKLPVNDKTVDISDLVKKSVDNTRTFSPAELDDICAKNVRPKFDEDCLIEVTNESSLAAARRLVCLENQTDSIICLNFASAKHAGGGFLGGSSAQEESLARSSALYVSINPQTTYYHANLACKNCFYTDHMIHSPDVPVFRDDADGTLLPDGPYLLNFVTAPAVNIKGLKQTKKFNGMDDVRPVMMRRVDKLLALCCHRGHDVLILGAWGCGIFENDSNDVAAYFKRLLSPPPLSSKANNNICIVDGTKTNLLDTSPSSSTSIKNAMNSKDEVTVVDGKYWRCFKRIVFAILTNDPSKNNTYIAFHKAFINSS